jgi:hypothetical protein
MLISAVAFWQIVLAVHIAAVMVAFGVTFAYPVIDLAGSRMDPRAMPWFYRTRDLIGKRLISPGLLLVLIAGVYLASKLHQWHAFYVQWGLAVAIVLGALGGGFLSPNERKLADLAERDIEAAGDGEVRWSEAYVALRRRVSIVGLGFSFLVLITVYLMTVQAGA